MCHIDCLLRPGQAAGPRRHAASPLLDVNVASLGEHLRCETTLQTRRRATKSNERKQQCSTKHKRSLLHTAVNSESPSRLWALSPRYACTSRARPARAQARGRGRPGSAAAPGKVPLGSAASKSHFLLCREIVISHKLQKTHPNARALICHLCAL